MRIQHLFTLWTFINVKCFVIEEHSKCDYKHVSSRRETDVRCHSELTEDEIPQAVRANIPEGSIFFIETSCKGVLDGRQACSIESAARANPFLQINVLFAGPIRRQCLKSTPFNILLKYPNIKFYRIYLPEYSIGTPLEDWISSSWSKIMRLSHYPLTHTSDMLRYLTLYKFGGVYLDLDMVIARGFNTLPRPTNWLSMESTMELASAVIAASRDQVGRKFTTAILRILKTSFKPDCWACNTRVAEEQVMFKMCGTTNFTLMSFDNCQGMEIYKPSYFFPIPYRDWSIYFSNSSLKEFDKSYGFHLWNSRSRTTPITSESFYGQLAHSYCPRVSYSCKNNRSLLDCAKEGNWYVDKLKDVQNIKHLLSVKIKPWLSEPDVYLNADKLIQSDIPNIDYL